MKKTVGNFHTKIPGELPWNLRMILSQLAKRSLPGVPRKNLEFQVGSNGRQGVMSPQKREIARSHTVRCSKDDEKRGGGEIIDLFFWHFRHSSQGE